MSFFYRVLALSALTILSSPVYAGQSLVCLIQPSQIAEIGSSVYGAITKIYVERGDYVTKGQKIAELQNDVELAALVLAKSKVQTKSDIQAAKANHKYTQQNLTRAEDLITKNFISAQELTHIRTEFELAEQKLASTYEQHHIWQREMDLAQSQLALRTLVSPISGIVAERYLSLGERVENRSVARVVSTDPLHIEVMVPAVHFGKIKPDMVVTVVPELPNTEASKARVILVDKLIDGASNTFRLRLELPNPDQALPGGGRCKVDLGLDPPAPSNNIAIDRHQKL